MFITLSSALFLWELSASVAPSVPLLVIKFGLLTCSRNRYNHQSWFLISLWPIRCGCAGVLAVQCTSNEREQSAIESCDLEVTFVLRIAFDYGVSMCFKNIIKNPASTSDPYTVLLSCTLKGYHIQILMELTALFIDTFQMSCFWL